MQADRRSLSTLGVAARCIVCIAFGTLLSGCNVMGWVSSAAASEAKTKAQYVLPKRPTVVIAENFANPAEVELDADPIARLIAEELRAQDVAPIISVDEVTLLQQSNREKFRQMTIAAVGREVGAEQIIYVNILNAVVEADPGTDSLRGRGALRVRVVDAQTGSTLWPVVEAKGLAVNGETSPVRSDEMGVSQGAVRSALHRNLATRAARLFYDYRPDGN